MKKLLSIILTILMLATSIPFALAADTVASGTCGADGDNLTWILDTDGTLTISGTGAMAEYSNVHLPMYDDYLPPWADYKESIKKIVIEEGVTELGRYAFYEHPAVKHISIADSVTNLVGRVFDGCSAVESLIIPAGVSTLDSTSFQDCSSLKKIVFLGKVDLEGYYAFDGCPELREIVFAKGATNNTIEAPFNTETINVSETVIHFGGTQAEAEAAFTPIDETRDVFFALATIHYIDGCNCSVCGEYHIYDNGICVLCGYECSHESYTDGKCDVCAYECPHENCTDYICDDCGEECPHKAFTDFICDNCGYECYHESYTDGKCNVCAYECPHESYTDYICDNCGDECPHEKVTDGICDACAAEVNIITITMSDSFGDGWNGNSIIIERLVDGAYTEAGTATIEAGASGTFTIVLSKDGIFAFSWLEGNYPEECSFTVAVDGETVYECTDGSTLNGGKVFYSICEHTFNTDGKCNVCGYECAHENYTDGMCDDCGCECTHEGQSGFCTICEKNIGKLVIDVTDMPYGVYIGSDQDYYDEDGYIITGINPEISVLVYEESDLTLRGTSIGILSLERAPADAVMNITLDGTAEVVNFLSFDNQHLVFDGGETDTFKVPSFHESSYGSSVTVNGGNIIIDRVTDSSSPTICCNGGFVINGGTVTASNNHFSTVLSPGVTLNGGELNVINTSTEWAAIEGTITMKKGTLFTASATNGILTDSSTIVMADGAQENDSFFVRYDTESEFVPVADIKAALDGKSYAEIKIDTHEHSFTNGICDACGFECPHENYADGECPDCGFMGTFIDITMNDSYGDGWNGNSILIKNDSDETIGIATINDGVTGTYSFMIAEDGSFSLTWQKGSYAEECTFEVAADGNTVFVSENCVNYEDGEVVYIHCDHEFVNSVCTKCGNPCLHDTDNGECSLCGKYLYVITHQPTEEEPFVEVNNDTDAAYQWYVAQSGTVEITDENAIAVTPENFGLPAEMFTQIASYDPSFGWQSSVIPQGEGNAHLFFAVDLKAGDVINVTFSQAPDYCLLSTIGSNVIVDAETEDGIHCSFTVPEDGMYILQVLCNDLLYVSANMEGTAISALEGETDARLQNIEYGKEYLCEVTFADGTTEQSDVLDFSYRITHQPTEAEPYVELNNDTDASYQWYEIEYNTIEITDENADTVSYDWGDSSYDAETGWTGVPYNEGDYGHDFFTLALEAGDTVKVELTGDFYQWVGLFDYETNEDFYEEYEPGVNTYEITVTADGNYTLYTYVNSGVTVKAYIVDLVYSEMEGETDARLQNMEYGNKYLCEVTFADGTAEESDILDLAYRITRQPTAGAPYVELNDDTDATYQWYEIEYGTTEITDETATVMDGAIRDAEYVPGEGWHIGLESEYADGSYLIYGFERVFKAGDQIILDVTTTETDPELWLGGSGDFNYAGFTPDENGRLCATVELTDSYQLFSGEIYDPDMIIKAYLYSRNTPVALEGETDARLQNPEFGSAYFCEVTFADGTSEVSDSFEYVYAITHQPTEEEPYVELNDNTDASYQWYTVEGGIVEITDEEATGSWSALGAPSELYGVYDPQTGWTSSEGYYFVIELQEGETVALEASESVFEWWIAYAENPGMYTDDWAIEQYGTTCSFTATADGYYGFSIPTVSGVAVRAYVGGSVYTAVNGQTTDTLTPDAIGQYACEVTFADGTTEMSDTFEVTSVHTCDFSDEWKYDADKHWKECECGLTDEEAEHSYTDGKCDCGYECKHADTVSDIVRPVQNVDGSWGKGAIVAICSTCGTKTITQEIERDHEGYQLFDEAAAELQALLDSGELIAGVVNSFSASLNGLKTSAYGAVYTELEKGALSSMTASAEGMINAIKAGLADGTMKKADLSYMTSLLEEVNALIDSNPNNIVASEYGNYYTPYSYYMSQINNGNLSQADYDRNMAAYGFEKQLENLLAGLKDGTALKADYTEIDQVIAGIDDALKTATVSDEMQAELDGIRKELDARKADANTSVADLANSGLLARAKAIATAMNNCANGVHSFTAYEVVTAPDCDDAGKEVAFCDNGCGETDEKEIAALTHSFTKYEEVTAPECGKAGTEVATCDNGCGATDEKEIPALTHKDDNGDYLCDHGCGTQISSGGDSGTGEPETPDEPTDTDCDHLCHSDSWVFRIFWRIINFFQRLFNIQQYCDCGALHYEKAILG